MWDEVSDGLLLADTGCGPIGQEKAIQLATWVGTLVTMVSLEVRSWPGMIGAIPLIDIDFNPATRDQNRWGVVTRPVQSRPANALDYDVLRNELEPVVLLAKWALHPPGVIS